MNNLEQVYVTIIAIILLIAPFFDWITTKILRKAAENEAPEKVALKERATVATALSIATTLNAVLALSVLFDWDLGFTFTLILSFSLLLGRFPNAYWLYLYQRNKFKK